MFVGTVSSIQGKITVTLLSGITKNLEVGDSLDSADILSTQNSLENAVLSLSGGEVISLSPGEQWQFQEGVLSSEATIPTAATSEGGNSQGNPNLDAENIAGTDTPNPQETDLPPTPTSDNSIASKEGHSNFRVSRQGEDQADGSHVLRTAQEVRPKAVFYSSGDQHSEVFNNTFSGLSFNSSFQAFRDAFYSLINGGRTPTLIELTKLGISG